MNHIKFALAIVMALLIVVMLAWGQGSSEVDRAGQVIRGASGNQFAATARPASLPSRDVADLGDGDGDVDVLEMFSNPSVRRSPLSVHQQRAVQARGTAVPLQLDVEQYKRIRFEHHLQLDEFPLPAAQRGEAVQSVTLHLERLPVISDETIFVLGDANAPDGIGQQLPTPDMAMYRGTIEGDPDSRVFLSLAADTAYGYIRSEHQTHLISPGPHGEQRDLLIYNLTAMPAGAIPWRDFVCSTPPKFVDLADLDAPPTATSGELPCRRVQLAIDTDRQFTDNLFGGDMTAASIYAATMVGAASEIYLNDVNAYFELNFIRLWTGEDIWTGFNTFAQLIEFQQHWQSNMGHIQRDLAHYLSGRALGGGVAWLNAICHSTNGYALSANLSGHFPYPLQDNHSQNWDIMVFAHELGHNFGAPHTHDVCPPVDQCAPPQWHGQCQDETACISNGTIMSYCHTCSGGLSNVVLEFHPTIRDIMLSFLDNIDSPSCPLSTGTKTCSISEGCEWVDLDGGMNNAVWALGEYNGDLIAGGDFTNVGGQTMQRIARWDGDDWNFIGAANNTVRALTEHDGELIAGGLFTVIGGQTVGRIARWNGSQWAPLGVGLSGGPNPRVFDLKVFDGDLYAAGTFLNSGEQTVNRIARWDGNEWHTLGEGMNSNVYALAVYDEQLYAAGSFTEAGGVTAHRIARWDGSQWQPVGGGFNDIVFALTVYDGDLIAGGLFTAAGGISARRVARWDGSTWHPLDDGVNDLVQTMTVHNDSLYVGGGFAVAGTVVSSRLAQWDGEQWNAAAIGVNNMVRAILPHQGGLAVGGSFTLVSGQPINRIALVDCGDDCRFADLNCDGFVDGQDLLILLAAWGQCPDPNNCPADLNGDGFVDGQDLLLMLANWG